ncbi:MAG: ABC transporter permease [Pseudolysinimonas sp.]|uniref:ABC transporter permease n=1 Tax=Pseudolysinimonas sp. TaxID=2680009 RepID=UPI00326655C3
MTVETTYLRHDRPLWRRLLLRPEAVLIVAIILVIVVSIIVMPNYLRPNPNYTFSTLLLNAAPILILALPLTLIIVTGEIDISIGSVLGLSSAAFGLMFAAGIPLPVAALISVAIGGLVGAFNGVLVTVVGLPSLAVTIGTLALFRGIAVGVLGTTAVTGFPSAVTSFVRSTVPGTPIPWLIVMFIVMAIGFGVLLHFTAFGRGVFAIGLSPENAAFSGVNVSRTKFTLFVLSGLVAGLVGVLFTLQYSNAIGSNGNGFELRAVTAIVLGGVSIWGGTGSLLGGILGGLFIATVNKSLQVLGIGDDAIYVITGTALIASVVVSSVAAAISQRRRAITSTA